MIAKNRLSILLFLTLTLLAPKTIFARPCHATSANTHLILMQVMRDNNVKTKGFAVTVKNDTLKGYFLLDYYKGVVFQKEQTSMDQSSNSILDNRSLKSIFLELRGLDNSGANNFTEYVYLPEYGRIFRKIYSGTNDYYDENKSRRTPERVIGDIVVLQKGTTKSIAHISTRDKSPKKSLVDFLNKTWQMSFSYKDFRTTIEVIREIETHS
jgi:hypothetical protein